MKIYTFLIFFIGLFLIQNLFAQNINGVKIFVSKDEATSLTFHSEVTSFNFEQKNAPYKIVMLNNSTILVTISQTVNELYTLYVSEGTRRHKFILVYKVYVDPSDQDNDFSDLNKIIVNQNTTTDNPAKDTSDVKRTIDLFYSYLSAADKAKKNQQFQEATIAYEEALKIKPDNAYVFAQLTEIKNLIQKQKLTQYNIVIAKANDNLQLNKLDESIQLYKQALTIKSNDAFANNQLQLVGKKLINDYSDKAVDLEKNGKADSGIFYAHKVLELNKVVQSPDAKLDALNLLSDIYKSKHNADSLAKYLELTIATKDSLFNQEKILQAQNTTFNERIRQQEQAQQRQQLQNKVKLYSLLAALLVFFFIAFILYRPIVTNKNPTHCCKSKNKK